MRCKQRKHRKHWTAAAETSGVEVFDANNGCVDKLLLARNGGKKKRNMKKKMVKMAVYYSGCVRSAKWY